MLTIAAVFKAVVDPFTIAVLSWKDLGKHFRGKLYSWNLLSGFLWLG